jgi:hypothetical protein
VQLAGSSRTRRIGFFHPGHCTMGMERWRLANLCSGGCLFGDLSPCFHDLKIRLSQPRVDRIGGLSRSFSSLGAVLFRCFHFIAPTDGLYRGPGNLAPIPKACLKCKVWVPPELVPRSHARQRATKYGSTASLARFAINAPHTTPHTTSRAKPGPMSSRLSTARRGTRS